MRSSVIVVFVSCFLTDTGLSFVTRIPAFSPVNFPTTQNSLNRKGIDKAKLNYRIDNDEVELNEVDIKGEVEEFKRRTLRALCWIAPKAPEDTMAVTIDAVAVAFYSQLYHMLSAGGDLGEKLMIKHLERIGTNNVVPSYTTMPGYSPCFVNAGYATVTLMLGWMLGGVLVGGYKEKNTIEGSMERSCLTAGKQFVASLPIWLGMAFTSQTLCGCEASIKGGLLPEDVALIGGMLCVLAYSRIGWNWIHKQFN